jgi:hypothetical protein
VTGEDARRALLLAVASIESMRSGGTVPVSTVDAG